MTRIDIFLAICVNQGVPEANLVKLRELVESVCIEGNRRELLTDLTSEVFEALMADGLDVRLASPDGKTAREFFFMQHCAALYGADYIKGRQLMERIMAEFTVPL